MLSAEVLVFTALLGAVFPLLVGCLFEVAFSRARWAMECAFFLATSIAFLWANTGLLALTVDAKQVLLLALAPPLTACISTAMGVLGIRNWLGTKKRESHIDALLLLAVAACAVMAVAVCVLAPLPAPKLAAPVVQLAYWVCGAAMAALAFAAVRVAIHGDVRAWEMVSVVVFVSGLNYLLMVRQALGHAADLPWLTIACVFYIIGNYLLLRAAWRRGRKFVHVARMLDADSGRDPITRLLMGAAMISSMDRVYARTLRQRHRPVVIVVQLFNADEIVKECGENGLNQVLLATLARIRNIMAPADSVGRYYGACFAIQIAGRATPQYLRGLGLRLAASTRRPVVPRMPPSGFEDDEPIETDVGVGICWIHKLDDFTLALHEAETAARTARELRSRAAVKLATDAPAEAVEKALGEARMQSSFLDSATASVRQLPKRLAQRANPLRMLKIGERRRPSASASARSGSSGVAGGVQPARKPSSRGGRRPGLGRTKSTMSTQIGQD
jgi:GGDEF domain-containing protein